MWRIVCVRALGVTFCSVVALLFAGIFLAGRPALPAEDAKKALQIYFVDVEGGQATLFVTPEGQSLLVDTGWPDHNARDAERIVSAAKLAGIAKIDYVLITHYHDDHVGGVPQLAARIPVGTFIDHGENRETGDPGAQKVWQAYQQVVASGKYKHIVAKPGEALSIQGMQATVVSADGVLIDKPMPGAGGTNVACAATERRAADQSENPRSIGTLIAFGKLRILDLGDLTWDKEMELMCPVNKLAAVDIFVVSHHGSSGSNSPALVNGIAPRVAIMDNGATKGGAPSSWDTVKKSPRLEDLWQLHYSEEGSSAHNVPAPFIANPSGPDAGYYLKLTAYPDGAFEIFNSRTRETKHYTPHIYLPRVKS